MKTNYEYFLKRRNLTTKTIIESNKIKDYKELLILCFSVYKNEFAGPDGGNGGHGGHVMFRANGKINSLR